ncbi:RecB family exonuclease [Hymenobacter latericus]|uniref:RecB family exonuclease n=1 Tax=Hymenobacter sp. YIM 151858-1 TaxID=2987688 RepID=UPI002227A7E4|nr:PD-(D/E)XK nuclease family protein [Hymenobacter sp. YIM 151858-1]UYZ58041.1 PD-(D/E)XK nuclease family protein [Hymenobacter sp. YIM 151858-1]
MIAALQPLTSISPSQFVRLQRCAYQVLLERSSEGKTLLAVSGSGLGPGGAGPLGTIIHKVLETANTSGISTVADFEAEWNKQVEYQEAELIKKQQQHLVPLAYRAHQYAVRKLLLCWMLTGRSKQASSAPLGVEQWLADSHGIVRGVADLIRRNAAGNLEVVDYKTGRITEPDAESPEPDARKIKPEYVTQLQLYAALLHESSGEWPISMLLADLAGNEYPVAGSLQECSFLLAAAHALFKEVNNQVAAGHSEQLARPATEVCHGCQVKQLCEPYAVSVGAASNS